MAALPAGVRELYGDGGGYGFLQQPEPDVLGWILDGAWSGHFGYLVFALGARVRGAASVAAGCKARSSRPWKR